MADDAIPGVFDLTPLNPAFKDDPHAILDKLREKCPVHHDAATGTFILSKYSDIRGILSDTSMWRSPERAEEAAVLQRAFVNQRLESRGQYEEGADSILFLDDPDHARIRKPLAQALYKRVARCRPLVQQVVDEWLDRLDTNGPFDVMAGFALPVPVDVIARILGVRTTASPISAPGRKA